MKFDENRVYTALNADKLPIGSKVIVADNLVDLKMRVSAYYDESVTAYITEICDIRTEDYADRFEIVERHNSRYLYGHYGLAYLVSEPNHIKCEDLKIGDILTDGNIDYMVLGINRSSNSVYLPHIGWCNYFRNLHKKEVKVVAEQKLTIKDIDDMFDFCQKSCGETFYKKEQK